MFNWLKRKDPYSWEVRMNKDQLFYIVILCNGQVILNGIYRYPTRDTAEQIAEEVTRRKWSSMQKTI